MTNLLTINHYMEETNNFIREVSTSNTAHYFYASKPQPWSNTSGGDDDSAWKAPNNSVSQIELDVFDDLLFGKLITSSDVNRVIPKYEWVSNTVYSQYDQNDPSLYTKNFYVVTTDVGDEYNVFKCIDNNSNTASTIKPSLQTTSGTFKTGDGYTWKYMYTIDVQSNTRFTTAGFMPVIANSAVAANAIPGTIDVIRISNTGSGYDVFETGVIDSVVDQFTVKLPSNSSSLDNYYTNSSIYIISGFGGGQVREISSYNGTTKNATLLQPIDVYVRLDFANADFVTGGSVGEIVRQVVDFIPFTTSVGFINQGSNVVQSDTGFGATVLSSNASSIRVSRFNTTQTFSNNFVFRDLSSSGTLTTDKVTISNTTGLSLGIVVSPGSGYSANANVTIVSATGNSASANAQSNSTGKIASVNIVTSGNGYATEPTVTISSPVSQSFNANTDITAGTGEGSNNVIALSTAGFFETGDRIIYKVDAGNTVISGLSNNSTYFIQFANTTVIALSNSSNTSAGNRIPLTKGVTEDGHYFQGITASGRILPAGLFVSNAASGAVFANDYSVGSFIRVGENANSNIRVIQSVNSTVMIVDRLFANSIVSANAYKLSTAILPTSIQTSEANGTISNTNLNSIKLSISNLSVNGASFSIGERVATTANTSNGTGTVVFSNTSVLYLTSTTGTLSSGLEIRGSSSNLFATIVTSITSPNITVKNPSGTFRLGELVYFSTSTGSNTGYAQLTNLADLSRFNVDYQIGPTVKIIGDGNGAIAVATVNTQVGMSNSIASITVINPGSNYTKANVAIYANSLYGSGASVYPVVSPLLGHGAEAEVELGSRYACLDMNFNTLATENWYYPSNISFRKFGIIKDPKFANVKIETTGYTSFSLNLSNTVGTWTNGEIVTQATTNAAGIVISGNSTNLKIGNCVGTFAQNYLLYGYSSGTVANTTLVQTIRFSIGETVSQPDTGATAKVVSVVSNTNVNLTNIRGKFSSNLIIQGLSSNASATVNTITKTDQLDVTSFFTDKFNQTARLTLGSNTGNFTQFEYVTQEQTNASGRIISGTNDLDLSINITNGSFSIGDSITNSNTSANAKVVFANSTYLKLSAVSNVSLFTVNNEIQSTVGGIAEISNVYSVLILSDVSKSLNFIGGGNQIEGSNSGTTGLISLVTNPDLERESGKVVYLESSNNVITKDINTSERVRIVIKF